MCKRLQTYQQEHNGSCNVPGGYPLDPQLGTWVSTQRTAYRKGLLTKERFDRLEEIGFQWADATYKHKWTEMFKRLQAYQQENNGSCNVPHKYHLDPKLGNWVNNQRMLYKKGVRKKRLKNGSE